MCGRAYETYSEEELYVRYLNEKFKRNPLGIKNNFNFAPTQMSPVLIVKDGQRQFELMRWGLVPSWAKDVKSASKYSLINARAEEIEEKRSYKNAFKKRRCILPLSGFFEWKSEGKGPKRPFAIRLRSKEIMSVAGIWESWKNETSGEVIDSFSIVTVAANDFMSKIHNRMPVILPRESESAWLDPDTEDAAELHRLLTPCPSEWLEGYEVSVLVNSPKNNVVEVLAPHGEQSLQ